MTFFIFSNAAHATFSIKVSDTVIKYGKTDIDIRCIVNGTSLKSIGSIQLKKSNTNIVLISDSGIFWQDKILETRSKINAFIENVQFSYLHLKIVACNVERTDEATYFCDLFAIEEDFSLSLRSSSEIYMNITGKKVIFCQALYAALNIISTMLKNSEARQKHRL